MYVVKTFYSKFEPRFIDLFAHTCRLSSKSCDVFVYVIPTAIAAEFFQCFSSAASITRYCVNVCSTRIIFLRLPFHFLTNTFNFLSSGKYPFPLVANTYLLLQYHLLHLIFTLNSTRRLKGSFQSCFSA